MKKTISFIIISASLVVSGCVPTIIGGGVGVGASVAEERGIGGALSDAGIRSSVNAQWFKFNPRLNENIEIQVREGRVLLTGRADDTQQQIDAVRLAWEVSGVREVIDETTINPDTDISGYASDSWVTSKVKTALLFESDVLSLNYSIKTVEGIVYIMGIAQSQAEIDRVIHSARAVKDVKNVKSYARIKGQIELPMEDPLYAAQATTTSPVTTVAGSDYSSQSSPIISEQVHAERLPELSSVDNPGYPNPSAY